MGGRGATSSNTGTQSVESFVKDMVDNYNEFTRGDLQGVVEAYAMQTGKDDEELLREIDRRANQKRSTDNRGYDGQEQLQGVGKVDARKVKNLKEGDILMWNFGYTSRVIGIEPSKSGKTFNVRTISSNTGNEYVRKMSANRLVGISQVEANNEREVRIVAITKGKSK